MTRLVALTKTFYEPRYAISTIYEVILGAQFHILDPKNRGKNSPKNILEKKYKFRATVMDVPN